MFNGIIVIIGSLIGVYRRHYHTASQALVDRKFSEASDVWAYAITCVEVWTDAQLPYKGWMNAFVMEEVLNGYKLKRPDKCPKAFYDRIIGPCLEFQRSDRPLFADLEPVAEELFNDPSAALDLEWSAAGSSANPFDSNGRRISMQTGAIVESTSQPPPQSLPSRAVTQVWTNCLHPRCQTLQITNGGRPPASASPTTQLS